MGSCKLLQERMLEWEKPNGIRKRRGKKLRSGFDAMLLGTGSPEVHTTKAGAKFFPS